MLVMKVLYGRKKIKIKPTRNHLQPSLATPALAGMNPIIR